MYIFYRTLFLRPAKCANLVYPMLAAVRCLGEQMCMRD